jgi:hypothetical protein
MRGSACTIAKLLSVVLVAIRSANSEALARPCPSSTRYCEKPSGRVFAEEPGGDSWIETLPRRGYRYVGPVAVKEQENQSAAGNEQPTLAPPDKPSLAVLPFTI